MAPLKCWKSESNIWAELTQNDPSTVKMYSQITMGVKMTLERWQHNYIIFTQRLVALLGKSVLSNLFCIMCQWWQLVLRSYKVHFQRYCDIYSSMVKNQMWVTLHIDYVFLLKRNIWRTNNVETIKLNWTYLSAINIIFSKFACNSINAIPFTFSF